MTECLQQEKWIKVCTWLIIWWTKVWKLVLCRAPLQLPSRFSCVDPSTPSQHHQPNNFQNIFPFSKYLAIFKHISKYPPPPLNTIKTNNFENIFQFSKYLAYFRYISKYLPPPLKTINRIIFKISFNFQIYFETSSTSQHHQPNDYQNIFQFSNFCQNIFEPSTPKIK